MTCHYCDASYYEDQVHVCQAEDLFHRIDILCDELTLARVALADVRRLDGISESDKRGDILDAYLGESP